MIGALLLFAVTARHAVAPPRKPNPDPAIVQEAVRDLRVRGVTAAEIESVMHDPRFGLEPKRREGSSGMTIAQYKALVLSAESLQRGLQFIDENRPALQATYETEGIAPPYIAGLFRAESNLGRFLTDIHRHRVANVWWTKILAPHNSAERRWAVLNLAALFAYCRQSPPKYLLVVNDLAQGASGLRIAEASRDENGDGNRDLFDVWTRLHHEAFVHFNGEQHLDPLTVTGSFAGAFGLGQFLPITYLSDGRDGDGDGVIDLYEAPDAAASTASFLRHHGWTKLKERALARYLGTTKPPWRKRGSYPDLVLSYAEAISARLIQPRTSTE